MIKVVIDTNDVISAAFGSKSCSRAIVKTLDAEVVEPPLIVEELSRFVEKLSDKDKIDDNSIRGFVRFIEFLLSTVRIVRGYPLICYGQDLPDNHFISLAAFESALLVTGDKLCRRIALENNVKCVSPSEYE